MVSTRSGSKTGRQDGASPRDGEKRRQRILRQLHIDGTAALRGDKIASKGGQADDAQVFKDGRYEVANDGVSRSTIGKKRAASDDAAAPPPSSAKRLRSSAAAPPKRQAAVLTPNADKKRKLGDDTAADDADFLAETIQRLKRAKLPRESSRQAERRTMLPYLQKLQHATRHRIAYQALQSGQPRGDAPGAYKVLRPGDCVHMPPGTYHLVFRLPGSEQTLGWARRVSSGIVTLNGGCRLSPWNYRTQSVAGLQTPTICSSGAACSLVASV